MDETGSEVVLLLALLGTDLGVGRRCSSLPVPQSLVELVSDRQTDVRSVVQVMGKPYIRSVGEQLQKINK